MEVVKRNLFSIVSGVVALLAMILAYYPLGGWFTQLSQKLRQSSDTYSQLSTISSTSHSLPILTLDASEAAQLPEFPSVKMIQQGIELVKELKQQSQKLSEIVMKMNAHVPLVPDVFPGGGAGQVRNQFKYAYYGQIEELRKRLNATSPPSLAELKSMMEKIRAETYEKQLVTVGGRDNKSELDAQLRNTELALPEKVCRERATQFTMYATSKALDPCARDGFMPARDDANYPYDAESMWAAQLGLWIEEDVVNAIAATNHAAKAPGVANAIVKRLIKLDIPKKYITSKGDATFAIARFMGGGGSGRFAAVGGWSQPTAAAAADASEPDAPSTKVYAVSATGRVCNSLYDVMHFTLVVDCDAERFRELMSNLTSNRFITIIRTDLIGLDRDKPVNRGFLYGKGPVVRVAMRCEEIMFRQWTGKWMPPSVKAKVKFPDTPASDNQ